MVGKLPRIHVPLLKPEDVIPHLGKPTHWKEGRSAKAVAESWFHANDIPDPVRAVLDQAEEYRGAELIDAWLERCVELRDGQRAYLVQRHRTVAIEPLMLRRDLAGAVLKLPRGVRENRAEALTPGGR